jgi:hypothetical protein
MTEAGMERAGSSLWRGVGQDAMRYWEPRRAIYNLVLAIVVIGWAIGTWPHFRPAVRLGSLFPLLILVLGANLCYSAAYVVDISVQRSSWGAAWRRWRWVLWLAGLLFAVLLANYWIADEIYPSLGPRG